MDLILSTSARGCSVVINTTAPTVSDFFNVAIATLKNRSNADVYIYFGQFDEADLLKETVKVSAGVPIETFLSEKGYIVQSYVDRNYGTANLIPLLLKDHVPTWDSEYFHNNIELILDCYGIETGWVKVVTWLRECIIDTLEKACHTVRKTKQCREITNENCFDGIIISKAYYPTRYLDDEYGSYGNIIAYKAERYNGWIFKSIHGQFKIKEEDKKYLLEVADDGAWVVTPSLAMGLSWAKNHLNDNQPEIIGEDPA